jgi:hypothetical protein
MKARLRAPISTAIAILVGFVILSSYFLNNNILNNLQKIFLQWAVILAAVALVVGVINLLSVHIQKFIHGQKGSVYSLIIVFSILITILVVGFFGITGTWSKWLFNNIQVPAESSLMGLVAVVLVYAIARMFSRKITLFSLVFVFTVLLVILGSVPIFGIEVPGLHGPDGLRALLIRIPALAGARGILLGVALGTIATGLRVLLGADRPYGG